MKNIINYTTVKEKKIMAVHSKARILKYYIPFEPKAKIDYNVLLRLYDIAEFNTTTQCYDTIRYNSVKNLAEKLNISESTLKRILSNKEYSPFISVEKSPKSIRIKNNIKPSEGNKKPFVCLNLNDISCIAQMDNKINDDKSDKYGNINLFIKYLLYVKYYCRYAKSKDFTANQCLLALGYSANTSYISVLPEYNKHLVEQGIINIKKIRDNKGYLRNIYSLVANESHIDNK